MPSPRKSVKPAADAADVRGVSHALLAAAQKATKHSYSPYSKFAVGAAVLTDDGSVVTGTNVENASYGLTICAERAAIFSAISQGKSGIRALAISGARGRASPPCGACRQVIREFAKADVPVFYEGSDGKVLTRTIGQLLPDAFRPSQVLRTAE